MEYVCLSPDPRVGWKLSAGMDWTPTGEWDLWVTDLPDYVYELRLRVEDGEVLEVKVHGNIRAEHLWLAGMRIA